jgi:hypothetical protein
MAKKNNTDTNLKFPRETKITGRSSTIRGAFIKAIIPVIGRNHSEYNKEDYEQGLSILSHTHNGELCSYCGKNKATELDHFRAVVVEKNPSKFISDIYNLVPSCGVCNQSKGGKNWEKWITGTAKKSPNNRTDVDNLSEIISNLRKFEEWSEKKVKKLSDEFLNSAEFREFMKSCENLIASFNEYQKSALKLQKIAESSLV